MFRFLLPVHLADDVIPAAGAYLAFEVLAAAGKPQHSQLSACTKNRLNDFYTSISYTHMQADAQMFSTVHSIRTFLNVRAAGLFASIYSIQLN